MHFLRGGLFQNFLIILKLENCIKMCGFSIEINFIHLVNSTHISIFLQNNNKLYALQ